MTAAKRLVPLPVPSDLLPRCEAHRSTRYLNDPLKRQRDPEEWDRCAIGARYRLGRMNLCTRHASIAALHVLLGEKP